MKPKWDAAPAAWEVSMKKCGWWAIGFAIGLLGFLLVVRSSASHP